MWHRGIERIPPQLLFEPAAVHRRSFLYAQTRRGFEDTVVRHSGHDRVDVVAVPSVSERIEELEGDFLRCALMSHSPRSTGCVVRIVESRAAHPSTIRSNFAAMIKSFSY